MKQGICLIGSLIALAGCGGGSGGAESTGTGGGAIETHHVSFAAGSGGSIHLSSHLSSSQVKHGSTASFLVTPDSGYRIASVSGCGGILDGNTYFTGAITEDCAVTASFALLSPKGLTATSMDEAVLLSWNAVAAATDYCVYANNVAEIHPGTAASYDVALSACIGSTSTSYTVTGLSNGSEYFFVVTTKSGSNESVSSNEVSVTPEVPFVAGLNDTGITLCGDYARDNSGIFQNNLDCSEVGSSKFSAGMDANGDPVPAGQDAVFGRDALVQEGALIKIGAGDAGFDFTKLDSNGDALPESALEWACVKDNVTGLVWEVKTSGGLRSHFNSYTWYNPDNTTNGLNAGIPDGGGCAGSACDTDAYVKAVNSFGLCGANDWRLPSNQELMSIVHNGQANPAIDSDYFPNTASYWYWSSVPYGPHGTGAWAVSFSDGRVFAQYKSNVNGSGDVPVRVRLVRGMTPEPASNNVSCASQNAAISASTPTEDFVVNGDGTVTHNSTGLMWMQCSHGQSWKDSICTGVPTAYNDWPDALEVAQAANAGAGTLGYDDWRLPNKNELASIMEYRCWMPAINLAVFPNMGGGGYWSSSPYSGNSRNAWSPSFSYGSVTGDTKDGRSNRVRLVRAGR